ncbi:MAG: major capsid protein [Microvirus sp.]|nr:MAG: major capsid protein [Microvirus sp.]
MSLSLPGRAFVNQYEAALNPNSKVPRSKFLNSWTRKSTFDVGLIYPILVEEILPGDSMKYEATILARLETPRYPLMDGMRIDTHFFFVPNRLVWTNWKRFMGEQYGAGDSINYTIPQIVSPTGGFAQNSIFDHMGLPVNGQITVGETITVNALPFRAYGLCYQEWFRDQNIQVNNIPALGDGPDPFTNYGLSARNKQHDYFTSCLPWPNKFTAPNVAFTGTAPVIGIGFPTTTNVTGTKSVTETGGGVVNYSAWRDTSTASDFLVVRGTAASGSQPQVFANLAAAPGVSINNLRQAFLIQELLERDARMGTRYIEMIKGQFDVTSPDARQQRPEYIGGGSTDLNVTPVAQTTPGALPVGTLGAAGTASGQHRASYAATEHGFILGLMSVRPELTYQQGLSRMWTRLTRVDHYFPALAGLGEQAVLQQEIFCTGVDAADNTVFGYQERWHEYRTRTSEVVGKFRSTSTGPLDAWHLGQRFTVAPTLNTSFINVSDLPVQRALVLGAASVTQELIADILFRREAVRPIPMYGVPVTLGRL